MTGDGSAGAERGSRTRIRLGLVLMAGSFVPFLASVGLAAAVGENRDGLVWPIVLLYAISVGLWYGGLAVGGSALVARVVERRRKRRARRAERRSGDAVRGVP